MAATDKSALQHLAGGMPATAEQLILTRRMRLLRPFLPTPCEHLVDFGCGNGAQTVLLADACQRVTGVDVNPDFLAAFADAVANRQLSDRVGAVLLQDGRMPLDDGAADAVTSFTVLEHVPDEAAALAEMRRVLKPGGKLIISVPNRWWVFETHGCDMATWPFNRVPWNRVPLVSWWPKQLHDRWARARIYRLREIEQMVTAAGFQVERSFRMTAPMDMIGNATLRRLVRASLFRPDRAVVPFQATENFVVAVRNS